MGSLDAACSVSNVPSLEVRKRGGRWGRQRWKEDWHWGSSREAKGQRAALRMAAFSLSINPRSGDT